MQNDHKRINKTPPKQIQSKKGQINEPFKTKPKKKTSTTLRLLKFYSSIDNQDKYIENQSELETLTETQRKREGRICAGQRGR